MPYTSEGIRQVASDLEDLIPVIKEMVMRLRTGDEEQPYAAAYWLRRRISRSVASLGAGAPNTDKIEQYYKQFIQAS